MASHLIAQKNIKKALEEDPSIFEYDEIYDNIKKENQVKEDQKDESKKETKAKYISNLLKTADKRKQEMERRFERKVQAEREAEGDQFSDKPTFVTTAYKKKLEERKAAEEKARYEEALEEAMDVKKQKDLSGFYKYFLNNTICNENKKKQDEQKLEEKKSKAKQKQSYRTRESRQSETEDEPSSDKKARPSNERDQINEAGHIDGDADVQLDSGSDSEVEDSDSSNHSSRQDNSENVEPKAKSFEDINKFTIKSDVIKSSDVSNEKKEVEKDVTTSDQPTLSHEELKKQKLDTIFKKRTVGQVLEEAFARYLERVKNRQEAD